jgi:hypothetical protein
LFSGLEVEVWLSQCLLSSLCFGFVSVSYCADLPHLYDALVQFHLILVGMEMHSFGYDIVIVVKVGKNTFVMTVQVNYLAYVQTNIPECRVCVLTRKIYSVITATDTEMLWLLLNYFWIVTFTIKTPLLNYFSVVAFTIKTVLHF